MSRRRQVLQLDDTSRETPPRNPVPPVHHQQQHFSDDDDDDDGMGDMPTPERLVPPEMMPNGGGGDQPRFGMMNNSLDNKVADFLAEIDALDPGDENDPAHSPIAMRYIDRDEDSPPRAKFSPNRNYSPVPERKYSPARDSGMDRDRGKAGAYSNMFVKGTPEFVGKKPEDKHGGKSTKETEPWPEEPQSEWEQLKDEKTNYPYYWNTVTNEVVWDMPAGFSAYLLLHKEYEEKVERGLREGRLDPSQRGKPADKPGAGKGAENTGGDRAPAQTRESERSSHTARPGRSRYDRHSSDSDDSSSDSSDSDRSTSRDKKRQTDRSTSQDRKSPAAPDNQIQQQEVPSSTSTSGSRDPGGDAGTSKDEAVLPDSTERMDKGGEREAATADVNQEDSMDFDIDDIDKELEMALERKRQELMGIEEKKKEDKEEDKSKTKEKDTDRKKDEQKHKDGDRKDDRHRYDDDKRRHGKHRDRDRDRDRDRSRDRERDRDRDRKHHRESEKEKEEKKPKLTLKERLRVEMELKMEKERRKKKAIEDLMARELEKTIGSNKGRKRHHEERTDRDEPRKRYRDDDSRHSRDEYRREYDDYDRLPSSTAYNESTNSSIPPPSMKPPPPTAEMIAYEEERRSQVVDYGHGRSKQDGDPDESKSADLREIEMKKLEALQLAELALSKLEFLEVTKKGLSKLQILLIELETRHQDWQAGGLTTNHFLGKLREANWQLEQYEESAAPSGWVCSWDRDYRRYFYTHQLTSKTQWDYPDATDIRTENEKAAKDKKGKGAMETDMEISSTSDRENKPKEDLTSKILASAASLPPPPPPPAEEHPSVKSLQLMYGSSSDSDHEEDDSRNKKKPKKEKDDMPPLPPLPPKVDKKDRHTDTDRRESRPSEKDKKEDKHGDREKKDKHKSKKKKKEKSKKKDKDKDKPDPDTAVGPQLPPTLTAVGPDQQGPVVSSASTNPWLQPPPPGAEEEVPVYSSTDTSGQNDKPLEFSQVQVSHGPETYSAIPSAYPDPYGAPAVDAPQTGPSEVPEGPSSSEVTSGASVSAEEKKKKKKEKQMGGANISLKKKHVSSMVQKWQKVKKEVELEERDRAVREAEIRRKLAELD